MGHFARTLLVLSVVLAAGSGRLAAAGGAAGAPRLGLVWIDVLDCAPYAFATASQEASAILADAGVETTWTLGDTATVTSGGELKIVLMAATSNGARLPEHVMGGTFRNTPSRTTWVYLANVLWALGLPEQAGRWLSGREQAEVARALGRVVAHEVVHAVAPDLPHSRTGLMAGRLGRDLLLQPHVSFLPAEQRALRAGVAAFGAPPEPALAAVALARARRGGGS